jgi:predicted transcriptional regulator
MSEEEILKYIFCCVSYKHMFDLSPQITESAQNKENLLFSSAVFYLRELIKSENITVEGIGPDDRFEVTEKGKEYLSSH